MIEQLDKDYFDKVAQTIVECNMVTFWVVIIK